MHSVNPSKTNSDAARHSRWEWLFSQGLGLICAVGTVLLLGIGSIVIAATREGVSAGVGMDDIWVFFERPSIVHLWFYLLLPLMVLYGLNTLLATYRNVVRKWSAGIREPSSYGAAAFHIAFLIGLLAHLIGGLYSQEMGTAVIGPAWTSLGDGRQARLVSIDMDRLPNGGVKQIHANLEILKEGQTGTPQQAVVEYNKPLSSDLGRRLFLLVRPMSLPGNVVLSLDSKICKVELQGNRSCDFGSLRAKILDLKSQGSASGRFLAQVVVQLSSDRRPRLLWLMPGRPAELPDGTQLELKRVDPSPAILVRQRYAAGNPWALGSVAFILLGMLMLWRRFVYTA